MIRSPGYLRVLVARERAQRPFDGGQPLTRQVLAVCQLRRRAVAAVAELRERLSQKRLRVAAGLEAALRALAALALLVVAFVIDDGPARAALVDVASHRSSSFGASRPRRRAALTQRDAVDLSTC
jgi:hypothetical protein